MTVRKKNWRHNLKRLHNLHSLYDVYDMYVSRVLGMKSWMFLRNAITSLMRMQSFVSLVWDFFSSELFSAFDTKKITKSFIQILRANIICHGKYNNKKPPRRQKNIEKIISPNNKSFLLIFSKVHWLYFDWKCHRKRLYEWEKFNWTLKRWLGFLRDNFVNY